MHIKTDEICGTNVFSKLKQQQTESAKKAKRLQMENNELKENVRYLSEFVSDLKLAFRSLE